MESSAPAGPEVMTTSSLATYLDISTIAARQLLAAGKIRAMRIGDGPKAEYRTRREWVIEYMEAEASGGPERIPIEPTPVVHSGSRRRH